MPNQEQKSVNNIAILIDTENVGLVSIPSLLDQISQEGRIVVKRAYGDWSRANKSRDLILELGIEPIQLFRSASGRKNSNDILLAIDAIELLHSSQIDVFVIVSSDSDFIPLFNRLRASGKIVYCAGEQSKISGTLARACDKHFYLDLEKTIIESKSISRNKEGTKLPTSSNDETVFAGQPDKAWERIDLAWSKLATDPGNRYQDPMLP